MTKTLAPTGNGGGLPVPERGSGRVLLVVPQPFYSDRGSPIAIREVVRGYLALGRQVDIVTFPIGEDFSATGLRIYRAPNPFRIDSVPIGFSVRKLLLDLTLIRALQSRVRMDSYDLVHALEEAAFPALWIARRRKIPLLYDMHSRLSEGLGALPGFKRGPLRWLAIYLEKWLFRGASLIVTSKGLAHEVLEVHPDAPVLEWTFSGTPEILKSSQVVDPRERLDLPPQARVVLYSGTFASYQGIGLLLQSAPLVLKRVPEAVFVLVGAEPGEERSALDQIRELGLADQVRVIGRQPRSSLAKYLRAADVLVSPRISGGNVPLKIFDYITANRAIVATDIPTHRTVLDETMALLPSAEPETFADAIVQVLTDDALTRRLVSGAQVYAHNNLGWDLFVENLREIEEAAYSRA